MTASVGCIVVLGRQGSGKGVQSARLAERLGYEHVSTGALLRHAVEEATPLGRAVEAQVAAGSLVSDDLVTGLVAERLAIAREEGHGLVLDGYPRTVDQAERLEELVGPTGIDAAVQIEVP